MLVVVVVVVVVVVAVMVARLGSVQNTHIRIPLWIRFRRVVGGGLPRSQPASQPASLTTG